MKKTTKKIYAILLIILMLMNYMPIITKAAEGESANLILESTASKYNVGDEILVDVKIDQLTGVKKIRQFNARIEYQEEDLQLEEIIITDELKSNGYSNMSNLSTKAILVTLSGGEAILGVNDTICTIKFKALKSSDTQTTVKVYNVDATDNDGKQLIYDPDYSVDDAYINEPEIVLPVPSKQIKHNLQITKTNNVGEAITSDSAIFKITKLDGEVVYEGTDSNGIITLSNLEMTDTTDTYTYTIEEVLAPTGYEKNEEPTIITVEFDEEGKVIRVSPITNGSVNITEETNTIDVKISNEITVPEVEKEIFNLVLNKVDEENRSITTDTAEFTITMPDGSQANYATVQSTGKTENIAILAPETAGTYAYIVKETKAPNGYIIEENNIIVELKYKEENNKIILESGNIVSYNNETVTITNDEIKTATVNIKNKQEVITYNYTINIDKVKNDTFNTNITEDTAIFEITKGNETSYIKTNQLGKATFAFSMTNKDIVEGQEYVYELKEIKAPNGYILDETTKTITITFNNDGTINTATVNGNKIEKVNNTTNVINVKIVNEKEPEIIVPEGQNFDLVINKVDENNNVIIADSAKFILTTPEGTTYELTTVNGISSKITLKAPNTTGKQIYFLKEIKAPEGYDILEESLIIEANFAESEGKIVLSSAVVKEYNEDIRPVNNTLTINVTNTRHQEEQTEYYNIKITGVDRNNNPIESGTTVVKLTNKITGEYIYKEVQIKDGIIELELPKIPGIAEYELQQIKAPEGYEVNPNPVQIEVNFERNMESKIEISNYTVTGEDASKGTSNEKNTISVIIINDEIKTEPQKQNYWIEINKLDSETKELITQGSAIFIVVDSKGNTKEYATTNGKVTISDIIPGNVGESEIFVIKEKVAPEGYTETAETIIAKVTFGEKEGKVVVTNSELIMGNSISEVETTQENNIRINIINEKEDEDLYVVSKKYSNGIDIYDLFTSYTGRHYSVDEPFIDTKEAKYGNNVSVQTFINNLESNGVLTVWDEAGNQVSNSSRVKTGMTLKATKGEQQKTFKIVVKGDSSKDGRVTTVDLNMLEMHLTGEKTVTDPIKLRALDLKGDSGDGRITTVDVNEFYNVCTM